MTKPSSPTRSSTSVSGKVSKMPYVKKNQTKAPLVAKKAEKKIVSSGNKTSSKVKAKKGK